MNKLMKILERNWLFVCCLPVMTSIAIGGCDLFEEESIGVVDDNSNKELSNSNDDNNDSNNYQCPWSEPEDLLFTPGAILDEILATVAPLSIESIRQDLDCLSELFAKQYAGSHYYDNNGYSLVNEIEKYSNSIDAPMNQLELMKNVLELHRQAYDVHLGYHLLTVDTSANIVQHSESLPYYLVERLSLEFKKEGCLCRTDR